MKLQHLTPLCLLVVGCGSPEPGAIALTGATIVDGGGGPPISDGVLIVRDGRLEAVGPATTTRVPRGAETIDLSGKYVIPGLINAHGHVGGTRGLEGGHYTEDNLLRQLRLYARYGVTTVNSLGGDTALAVRLRNTQTAPGLDRARIFVAGAVVTGNTEEQALAVVDANADMGVDWIKIRVDDNLGTSSKMAPTVYRAVIERTHERGLRLAAHLYYLEDGKRLLDAGADFLAHSVRDQPIDEDFLGRLAMADVCYSPTLTREISTYVYEDTPDFFDDPFFVAEADPEVLAQLRDPARQRTYRESRSAQAYKRGLPIAMDNVRRVAEGGGTIAMGTDTGPPARFQGYFEHMELALMVEAGLSPMDAIVAATGDAARCLGLDDLGLLQTGAWADFVVLDADPTADILNTRTIDQVWIAGARLSRP